MKKDFPKIYLTDHERENVEWCQDRITVDDVEYINGDYYYKLKRIVNKFIESIDEFKAEGRKCHESQ